MPKKLKTTLFQGLTVFAKVPTPNIKVADVCFTVARLRYALFHYKQNFLIFFCEKTRFFSFSSMSGKAVARLPSTIFLVEGISQRQVPKKRATPRIAQRGRQRRTKTMQRANRYSILCLRSCKKCRNFITFENNRSNTNPTFN